MYMSRMEVCLDTEIDYNGNTTYKLDAISQGFNYSISPDIYIVEDEESAVREIFIQVINTSFQYSSRLLIRKH